MSYVRWSGPNGPHPYDSALYIYDSYLGGITCCGCLLTPLEDGPSDDPEFRWTEHVDFRVDTHAQMISHVLEHKRAGHAVPDFVIERLIEAEQELM